jgi:glycosyltransferase involved in cell wall biosynthesis
MNNEILSIIVPCASTGEDFQALLDSLATQSCEDPWEVVVADNGAPADLRAIAARYVDRIPALRVVDALDRRGPAHARNRGVEEARGEMLAFIDADDQAGPGWVAAMAHGLREHPFVASRWDFQALNASSPVAAALGNPQEHGLQVLGYSPHMKHTGTGGLGILRALHERVGGFDESVRVLEDTDYCIRVQKQCGVELRFLPEAVVLVRLRVTVGRMARQQFLWAKYNVRLAKRYGDSPGVGEGSSMWAVVVWRWLRLWWRLLKVRRRDQWVRWARRVAWGSGLIVGAIRYRTAPPMI